MKQVVQLEDAGPRQELEGLQADGDGQGEGRRHPKAFRLLPQEGQQEAKGGEHQHVEKDELQLAEGPVVPGADIAAEHVQVEGTGEVGAPAEGGKAHHQQQPAAQQARGQDLPLADPLLPVPFFPADQREAGQHQQQGDPAAQSGEPPPNQRLKDGKHVHGNDHLKTKSPLFSSL